MLMSELVELRLELPLAVIKVRDGDGRVEGMLGNFTLGGVVLLLITLERRIWPKELSLGRRNEATRSRGGSVVRGNKAKSGWKRWQENENQSSVKVPSMHISNHRIIHFPHCLISVTLNPDYLITDYA